MMGFENVRKRNHKIIIGSVLGFATIMAIMFANTIYSSSDERLDEALELCNGNEGGKKCQQFLRRYDITFAYCHKIGDQVNMQRLIGSDGRIFEVPNGYPVYAVVWFGNSATPPSQAVGYGEKTITLPPTYFGCEVQN